MVSNGEGATELQSQEKVFGVMKQLKGLVHSTGTEAIGGIAGNEARKWAEGMTPLRSIGTKQEVLS